jgi:hypothetical protein
MGVNIFQLVNYYRDFFSSAIAINILVNRCPNYLN